MRVENTAIQEFVRVGAERWLEVIQDWLAFSTDCYVIMYEVRFISVVSLIFLRRVILTNTNATLKTPEKYFE